MKMGAVCQTWPPLPWKQKNGDVFENLLFWLKTFINCIEIKCGRYKTILEDTIFPKKCGFHGNQGPKKGDGVGSVMP